MKKLIKNSLGYDSDLFVYQDKEMFNYSVDTILLGNFATINSKIKRVLDIGTNNGALSIFVSERYKKLTIDAIDIQERAIEIANLNIKENKKSDQITASVCDFNDFWKEHNKEQKEKYDLILCNPPFYKMDSHKVRKGSEQVMIATHEVKINFEQIIKGSSKIIRQKGYLAMVMPSERLVDACTLLRKYNFEVKTIQMIHPREDQKTNLVLIEGRFQVGWGTRFKENLYLHPMDKSKHEYNNYIKKLYAPIKFDE